MKAPERVLYQFPISHYCEKTRWNLDAKGLAYRVHDAVPGPHLIALRRFGKVTTVPLLLDGGTVVVDSAVIAQHLERLYPERPLLPAAAAERARVLQLEADFDRTGRAVRMWLYGQLMGHPGRAVTALLHTYSAPVRRLGQLAAPLLELALRRKYGIRPERYAGAREKIVAGFDRVEQESGGDPEKYLVGDTFSLADLTAASMLAPLVAPPGTPWHVSAVQQIESIHELREELRGRAGWRWVLARYAHDR